MTEKKTAVPYYISEGMVYTPSAKIIGVMPHDLPMVRADIERLRGQLCNITLSETTIVRVEKAK